MKRSAFIRLLPGIISVPVLYTVTSCNSTRGTPGREAFEGPSPSDIAVGDGCDGCELMYEGMPRLENISPFVQLADPKEPGEALWLSGVVYKADGISPAPDVVLYIYHTDASGIYSVRSNQTHGRRHGHLRGWIKTDRDGAFTVQTIRPAAYPDGRTPAHIHIVVKEPGKTLYYIDEVWFADDPLVTQEMRERAQKRGGDLIIPLTRQSSKQWQGRIAITLGMNIPNYR